MRTILFCAAGLAAALVGHPSPSLAAERSEVVPIFRNLLDCRAIADPAERVACYDQRVDALAQAEQEGNVVIADKTRIRESKKALFGFGAIRLPIFGGKDDTETPTQIETVLKGMRQYSYGKWEYQLENGMVWRQVDSETTYPKSGQTVVVKTAALGSYFLKVGSTKAVRAMRVK